MGTMPDHMVISSQPFPDPSYISPDCNNTSHEIHRTPLSKRAIITTTGTNMGIRITVSQCENP